MTLIKSLGILIALVPGLLIAQIPSEYSATDVAFIERYVENLRQDFDLVIDPIERMPTQPTAYALASGNWGADWTGTNKHHQEIYDAAKREIVVVVFDTAPLFTNSRLKKVSWPEQDKNYTSDPGTDDPQGHGTHVAGIIGATGGQETIGLARALSDKGLLKIIARKVLNDQGTGFFATVRMAMEETNEQVPEWQRQGKFVIYNLSLGGGKTILPGFDSVLKRAKELGVFVCAASGNTYEEGVEFPANSKGAYATASIDSDGRRSSFSSFGPEVYMAKPGRNILSTYGSGLATLSGTSMATPGLAAMVAITASIYPEMTASDIEQFLIQTATDIDPSGRDEFTGHGYNFAGKILSHIPEEPEEPNEPQLRKGGKQTIRAVLRGPYLPIFQKGGGVFRDIHIHDIVIDIRTKMHSEDALQELKEKVNTFFTNRAMTLTDKADVLRAGYWSGRFLEIYLKKEFGIKSNIVTLEIRDENGNIGKPTPPGFFDYFNPSKRTTFTF